jgi:O-6-methylguanine DNA methyltransferase
MTNDKTLKAANGSLANAENELEFQQTLGKLDEISKLIDELPEEGREEFMQQMASMMEEEEDENIKALMSELFGTIVVGIGKTPAGYAIAAMEDEMIFALWYLPDEGFETLTPEQKQEVRDLFVEKNEFPPMAKIVTADEEIQSLFDQIAQGDYEVDPDQLECYEGTDFEVSVWLELLKIPMGETISYSELAERIGNPKATRAVANAVGDNPLPWIVPCHRVIEKNGDLGGYAFGIERKQKLLDHEQANKTSVRAAV